MAETITLTSGPARLVVVPAIGGSVARYASEHAGRTYEWLRPATAEALAKGEVLGMGSFPLAPFSNRIRDGRFAFDGREMALPLNFLPQRHTIHGHGWQLPWEVLEQGAGTLTLAFEHAPDAWPWPYRCRQAFRLSPEQLEIRLAIENTGEGPMPVGIGHHPYFLRPANCRLTTQIEKMWAGDDEVMPIELVDPPPERDFRLGVIPDLAPMDNVFTGWGRRLLIEWPEWDAALAMEADPPFDFFVCYTPPGQDHFCAEPVSTCIDAFNLLAQGRGDTGTAVLVPGQTIEGVMRLIPQPGRAAA